MHYIYIKNINDASNQPPNHLALSKSDDHLNVIDSNLEQSDDEDIADLEDEELTMIDCQQEEIDYDQYESTAMLEIIQSKRLSCFAHDLMLAVQKVRYFKLWFIFRTTYSLQNVY